MKSRLSSSLNFAQKIAWASFLVALPVTSFPYLPKAIGGGALVRPLVIYPLILLLALVTLPRLFGRRIPRTILSLLPFVVLALAASLLSLLRGIEPIFSVSVGDRVLRALITLALGCAVYLSAALASRTKEDLHFSLRWLYAGMSLALLWGSLQALYIIHFNPAYFERISQIQSHISIRRLFHNRISGLTYEPNWFAEQITFLLLPWLLSSVLTGTSVFRWRWHRLTVESLLLVWSVALLPFTFSRAGLLNLFVLIAVGVLLLFIQHRRDRTSAPVRRVSWPRRVAVFGLTISALGGLIFFAGSRNEFFSRLWSYWGTGKEFNLSSYFSYLGFDARFTYSETAYNVYKAYPLFGVGLGNYAFYFREMMPETPLAYIPEVLRVITPGADRNLLITPKNFYLRLLAETGLVGTAAFFVFLIAVFGCTLYLWLSPRREERFWGAGGLLALVAFALSTFSFDSFAIPNMWVIFGLITAAAWVAAHSEQEEKDGLRQSGALPRPITASFAANLPPGEEVPHS